MRERSRLPLARPNRSTVRNELNWAPDHRAAAAAAAVQPAEEGRAPAEVHDGPSTNAPGQKSVKGERLWHNKGTYFDQEFMKYYLNLSFK